MTNTIRTFYLFILVTILVLLSACSSNSGGDSRPPPQDSDPTPTQITFENIGSLGIYDPSVTYDPDTQRLWMSYSYVDPSIYFSTDQHFGVGIRLAYSDDGGVNWTDAGVIVSAFTDETVGPLPSVDPSVNIPAGSHGTWQSETSSLVYDANAPAAERWKIIWHQYLRANGTSYFVDYAWIAMKTAATATDLSSATPIKLFSGLHIQPAGEITGAPAYSPIAGPAQIALNSEVTTVINGGDTNDLDNCVWAEPGLLADNDGLHLAINCQYINDPNIDAYIVMFSCNNPCDMTQADNWIYKGRVLTPDHAQNIGFRNYSAAELSTIGNDYYLTVTPVRDVAESAYEGCRVYQFGDFANATLLQNQGEFVEVLRYDGIIGVHNGACSAHEQMTPGILHSQFRDDTPPVLFHMQQTHVAIP
jgi:hypothetical protein